MSFMDILFIKLPFANLTGFQDLSGVWELFI